jgi:signal transduction histidine kinase
MAAKLSAPRVKATVFPSSSASVVCNHQNPAPPCAPWCDITTWKRTEQELREAKDLAEQANRQKSDFLARISHELRTPLNAIMGFSEVMRTERFGELRNEKYRGYANDIHSSGEHLLALINDLLDLSKVEAGKLELNFTAESIAEATDHAMRLLQEEARTARVLMRTAFPAKLPRVVADHRALRQIMLNLLSNAIKYTNAGGQVVVSASVEQDGSMAVRVKDTGIGMTEEELLDALQPFTRVDSPNRERQGTGLGLPLTKALTEANRAKFHLSSAPNQGTQAEILFPGTRVLAE